jgi:DNA (cytosine-5)-methyltransferase 1
MEKLKTLDLFSGIGGFSLGLERTGGFETVAFCEIDPFCRRVLAKHWPTVRQYEDVRTLTAERLSADGISVDVICGGFPCQDISFAGKGAGIKGERSGLWTEYARLVDEIRPSFVIVENVAALLSRGLDVVLGDLATLGFDAEWHCIPAAAVGAPHRRDRLWIVAYPNIDRRDDDGEGSDGNQGDAQPAIVALREPWIRPEGGADVAHAARLQSGRQEQRPERERARASSEPESLADATNDGAGWRQQQPQGGKSSRHVANAASWRRREDVLDEQSAPRVGEITRQLAGCLAGANGQWVPEPDVGRVAHGIPSRVDRLRTLGNAVVSKIPKIIGNAILAHLQAERVAA